MSGGLPIIVGGNEGQSFWDCYGGFLVGCDNDQS